MFIYFYKWYEYCENSKTYNSIKNSLFYQILSYHIYYVIYNNEILIQNFSSLFIPFDIIKKNMYKYYIKVLK